MKIKNAGYTAIMRVFSTFMIAILATASLWAQNKEITGVIKDGTGVAAVGVSVQVEGTTIATMTDKNGAYSISAPEDAKYLVFKYEGMDNQRVAITSDKIDFTFDDATMMEELVVVGYGSGVNRRDLTGPVGSVDAKKLDVPVASAAEAITGKLAGVHVTTTEGDPDADIKVRVRGGSSLTQNAEPLYIVDGMPVSSISDIPPSDIKSIEVLKDAASTAIYGAQGANGVILVTTKDADDNNKKQGKGGKFTFNVDYMCYGGFKEQRKKYDMFSSVEEFLRMQYEFAYLFNQEENRFQKPFNPNYETDKDSKIWTALPNIIEAWNEKIRTKEEFFTDWQDETFGRTGSNWNHSATVSAGNKIANIKLSYSYIDDKAIMYESNYTRHNISLKANIKPIKNMTISVTGRYIDTEILGAGTSTDKLNEGSKTESRVRNAIAYTPIKFAEEYDGEREQEGGMFDPITVINDNHKLKTDRKWGVNGYISYKFLKSLTVKSQWGYEAQTKNENRYYGPTSSMNRGKDFSFCPALTLFDSDPQPRFPSTVIRRDDNSTFLNTNTIEYKKTFKKNHNFTALLGEETVMKTNKWEVEKSVGYGYVDGNSTIPEKEQIDERVVEPMVRWTTNFIDPNDNLLSFFGRAEYNYKGRYYASATVRADASNRFAKGNQWGFFPSGAIAWRMSDETWFKEAPGADKVNELKWRFSYGKVGNNNVDLGVLYNWLYTDYAFNSFDTTMYSYTRRFNEDIIPNPNLKWEETITRNFGLDYGFFRNRLSGTIDLYWNNTKDLIVRIPTGTKYRYDNVGETETKGFEFTVRGVILDNRAKSLNYSLNIDANIAFNKNKIISLGGIDALSIGSRYLSGDYKNQNEFMFMEGQALGRVYGYLYDGYYTAADFTGGYDTKNNRWLSEDGKPVASILAEDVNKPFGGARPGMMKLKTDENGNPIMDVIGNTMPICTGGFSISGHIGSENWGNIDVAAYFTYSIGNDVINLTALDLSTVVDKTKGRNNLNTVAYGERYTLFNKDGKYLPALMAADPIDGIIKGDEYARLVNELDNDINKNASIYNPVHRQLAFTDNNVEDGSFLRFSTLTVGYSLAEKWIKKAHLTKVRVFFTASNLFCWSKYSGNDPEVDVASKDNPLLVGIDWSAYPKARAFNFGINLSF